MRLFMQASNNRRMEFCLLIANHGGFEIVGRDAWKQAAAHWITLFQHPSYLRVEGKPLLVIFSPRGADKEALDSLQQAAREAGLPGVAVAGCGSGKLDDGFALRTHYNVTPKGTWGSKESQRHPYQKLVDANAAHATRDRLALVYAWNEIGEGGWLVPCKDDPEGAYLKAIRRVVLGR